MRMELLRNLFELLEIAPWVELWVHGGGSGHGSGVAGWVSHFLTQVSESGLEGLSRMLLPGLSEIGNIHPILVHFPIALLSCFVVAEIFAVALKRENLRIAASWMLYLGCLGAMATVATGFMAASTVAHDAEVHAVIIKHRAFGLTVLSMAIFLSVWRLVARARFSPVGAGFHLLIGIVMIIVMMLGADLGGLMVYKYGVNVQAAPQPMAHDHNHDHGNGHDHAAAPPEAPGTEETQAEVVVPKKAINRVHVHKDGAVHEH